MPSARTSSKLEALYEIGHILGRGASGVAFIVRPKPTRESPIEHVAKEIWLGRFDDKRKKDAFAECKLLQKLSHNHIVTCLDIILDKDVLYIVMEYANGGDLSHRIMARKREHQYFTESTVMSVFVQICTALHHIHLDRILHRDLKPANVFIFGEGELDSCTIKLGDFGIAKMLEGTHCEAHSTVGTPSYLSPEICKNNPYGRQSDIWALGVVLYELACLKVPFQAGNLPAMALMICTCEPPPVPTDYSGELADLVKSLLDKEPTKRPAVGKVLHTPYVQRFMSEELVTMVTQDVAAAQNKHETQPAQVRRASLPKRVNRSDHDGSSRLPSCGPAVRPRIENPRLEAQKFLLQEDARQWCWRRPMDTPGSDVDRAANSDSRGSGNTPRHGHDSTARGQQQRSDRARGRRPSPSKPVTPPQQTGGRQESNVDGEVRSPTHPRHDLLGRGLEDVATPPLEREPPPPPPPPSRSAECRPDVSSSRPYPHPQGGNGSFVAVPPLPLRTEVLHNLATRSASPKRTETELPAVNLMKTSGSTPALPPLPRLLAPSRVPTRSRSSACLQQTESKGAERSEGFPQRGLGPPVKEGALFRTAPAFSSGDSLTSSSSIPAVASNASAGPPPPIGAPPPAQPPQPSLPPPPPPPALAPPPAQRQAPRDDSRPPQVVEGVLSSARHAAAAPSQRVQAVAAPVAQPTRVQGLPPKAVGSLGASRAVVGTRTCIMEGRGLCTP